MTKTSPSDLGASKPTSGGLSAISAAGVERNRRLWCQTPYRVDNVLEEFQQWLGLADPTADHHDIPGALGQHIIHCCLGCPVETKQAHLSFDGIGSEAASLRLERAVQSSGVDARRVGGSDAKNQDCRHKRIPISCCGLIAGSTAVRTLERIPVPGLGSVLPVAEPMRVLVE